MHSEPRRRSRGSPRWWNWPAEDRPGRRPGHGRLHGDSSAVPAFLAAIAIRTRRRSAPPGVDAGAQPRV